MADEIVTQETKVCTQCKRKLPRTEFRKYQEVVSAGVRRIRERTECFECGRERCRERKVRI